MELTRAEVKRAIRLQRRLKILRWWERVGKIVCKPWTFYQQRRAAWHAELTALYIKKFGYDPPTKVVDSYATMSANPFYRVLMKEEFERAKATYERMLKMYDSLVSGAR